MYLTIDTYGEELVAQELFGVGDRAVDMTPLWPAMIARFEEIEREQFLSDGARGPGGRWEEVSPDWKDRKWKQGLSLETMRATEALYDALATPSGGGTRIFTPYSLQFGASDLIQFRVHQDNDGTQSYPIRNPIDLTPQDVHDFAMVMLEYVVGTRNAAGAPVHPKTKRFAPGRNPLR